MAGGFELFAEMIIPLPLFLAVCAPRLMEMNNDELVHSRHPFWAREHYPFL